ncbi:MAG: chemotaxis protein CheW [Myxococcales bacterium]
MRQEDELATILPEFIVEARDNLAQFERALLELESGRDAALALQTLFRAVHSIKGSCGFFHLAQMERLTHAAESLLDDVRSGRLGVSDALVNALLSSADTVRVLLHQVERDGTEGAMDVTSLVSHLQNLGSPSRGASDGVPTEDSPRVAPMGGEVAGHAGRDGKIRVDTALLERLMNLVGELVLARNQVVQSATGIEAHALAAAAQRLSIVTSELQEVVMKTRMQPIEHVFNRFPRLARDLAKELDKRIRLDIVGRETELDRNLLETIQDPLTHLVRNAIAHGVESPEQRRLAGKSAEGTVLLRAFHQGGMVNIEVSDDGAGIDFEAVRATAIRRGMASADVLGRMSEQEVAKLVFAAGFSTRQDVTSVAGRGVGMDVVKSNVEGIGGSVELHTERGRGTTVKIKIPLTLAIIPALIVSAGGERFAIPQASLFEVVRLADGEQRRIELVQNFPVLRLRGRILPLVYLADTLGMSLPREPDAPLTVIVLQAGARSFGLVVEDIHDTEEIVVKPLWNRLKGLNCYAGATIMGDGRVALILEPLGLAQRVGLSAKGTRDDKPVEPATTAAAMVQTEQVLVCRAGGERLAIELSKVARLEHLAARSIERAGRAEVTQYRGTILPLVRVAQRLEERRRFSRGPVAREAGEVVDDSAVPVVVHSQGERSIGLVVDAILDIVDVHVELQRSGARRGVRGSMVIQGRVTEFLDIEAIVRGAEPGFYGSEARA